MAKVNMAYKFRTLDKKIIPYPTGKTRKVMKEDKEIEEVLTEDTTLKHVCIDALLNTEADRDGKPVQVEGQKKFERWELSSRIYSAKGIIELKSEEITLLKELVGKGYGPLIVGQAWEALEGKCGIEPKKRIPKK